MPFSCAHNKTVIISGKEYMDFSKTYHNTNLNQILRISPLNWKRASLSTSILGSVAVEASLILPIFFIAFVCMLSLFEIQATKITVRNALQCAGQAVAYQDYITPIFDQSVLGNEVVLTAGAERLNGSFIVGGASGINCSKSARNMMSHEYHFTAEYHVKLPFSMFGVPPVKQSVTLRMKGWNGASDIGINLDDIFVYVTENGQVYHKNASCTYLDLSIHSTALSGINEERNVYQEKYRPCEYCGGAAIETVYITNMGNRYHSHIGCSGLKRQVRSILLSRVGERRPCLRCGY